MYSEGALELYNGIRAADNTGGNVPLDISVRPNYPAMRKSTNVKRDPIILDKKNQPNAELGRVR